MPTIEFLAISGACAKTVRARPGAALVDVCDEHMAPVPFSCRSATCGTCHLAVLEGAELLVPPEAEERELLDLLRGPPGSRLACQAVLGAAEGTLRLRPVS